jgi:hypothetical protein
MAALDEPPRHIVTSCKNNHERVDVENRTTLQVRLKGREIREKGYTWDRIAEILGIYTANGFIDPGMAYRIVIDGYEPKRPATRLRLGLPPICPTCYQHLPKPPRITRFDKAQMDAVIAFLREHEKPGPRVYARGGKLVRD